MLGNYNLENNKRKSMGQKEIFKTYNCENKKDRTKERKLLRKNNIPKTIQKMRREKATFT